MAQPSTKRLSTSDAAFLNIESRDTPMHIAGLQIYTIPEGAPADFIKNIVHRFRTVSSVGHPFNLVLNKSLLSSLAPTMTESNNIDLDYHVRHSALPDPGGQRELGELVSHLHSQLLDRSRPLWTCHVIEGLEGNQFAIYSKMHHALADGISAMRLHERSLAKSPDGNWFPAWEKHDVVAKASRKPKAKVAKLKLLEWPAVMNHAFKPMFQRVTGTEPVLRPFEAPHSVLNGKVTGARRVATQQLDLARIKAVAKIAGGSVNDVFLAICSSAIRRHLQSQGALPDTSLIAGVPVSIREENDVTTGNAIGFLWTVMGTDIANTRDRYHAIQASMEASKNHLKSIPQQARLPFTFLTFAPAAAYLVSGLGAKVRPPMNLTISNVPGPAHTLYLNGARLEASYPISIPTQGQALNITGVSYDGMLNVGFTGSRDNLPSLQKMAIYSGEALEELEREFGIAVKQNT
jgi:diacylglycerol O-acyltransferase